MIEYLSVSFHPGVNIAGESNGLFAARFRWPTWLESHVQLRSIRPLFGRQDLVTPGIEQCATGIPIGIVRNPGIIKDFELLTGGCLFFGFRVVVTGEECDHSRFKCAQRLVNYDGIAFPL